MKNAIRVLTFISISLVVLNCSEDEKLIVQGKVQFAVALATKPAEGGRIFSNPLPDGAYISLSIETASGVSIHSLKRIELMKLGDAYITAPVDLTEGSYRLTDFMILSKEGEALFATPKEGSDLAVLVDDALPVNFSISRDGVVSLSVQVVEVRQQTPEDFGYVSFGVEVMDDVFSILLLFTDDMELNFKNATLYIYKENQKIYEQSLLPKINAVHFKGDLNASYRLVVSKEGYTTRTKEFVLRDLVDQLNGKPLMLSLSPAATITVRIEEPTALALRVYAHSDNIIVDWGDGMVEHAILRWGTGINVLHHYAEQGRYYVNITGTVSSVTDFDFEFTSVDGLQTPYTPIIEAIDITQLIGLEEYALAYPNSPEVVDFSHNTKLNVIKISDSAMKEIDISHNPLLVQLEISGTPISTENIVDIIDILYENVIANNFYYGRFSYGSNSGTIPLPEESMNKLNYLYTTYKWF